jgi:hypothetical protein
MKKALTILLFSVILTANAQVEARLPFSNIDYNSMSMRPLNLLETDYAVRFYINLGGSVDRIITLKADSIKRNLNKPDSVTSILLSGTIQQIGQLFFEATDSSIFFYKEISLHPDQVDSILRKVQKLDLRNYQSRKDVKVTLHEPNSLYTIELKTKKDYHSFYFYTLYPTRKNEESVYGNLQSHIFQIFPSILEQIK